MSNNVPGGTSVSAAGGASVLPNSSGDAFSFVYVEMLTCHSSLSHDHILVAVMVTDCTVA